MRAITSIGVGTALALALPEVLERDPDRPIGVHFNRRNAEIGSQFAFGGIPRDLIGRPRLLQGVLRLPERKEDQGNTNEREKRAKTADQVGLMRGVRSFFRRDGGAPLSAQIGGVVVFSLVTGIGIVVGIGRIVRRRLSGWVFLFGGLCAYGLFLWWSSPA